jgi:hypothetical protein
MTVKTKIAALLAASSMLMAPAVALAEGPTYTPAPPHPTHPTHPAHPLPGPNAPLPQQAKAYGVKCKSFLKTHEQGKKGTPFSECVKAMAIAATTKKTAKAACKALPKTHVKGQKGTEFSRCVVAAAKVKKEVAAS